MRILKRQVSIAARLLGHSGWATCWDRRHCIEGARQRRGTRSCTGSLKPSGQMPINDREFKSSFLAVLTLASIGATLVIPASADDHEPPNARLRRMGNVVQKAYRISYCWTTQDEDGIDKHLKTHENCSSINSINSIASINSIVLVENRSLVKRRTKKFRSRHKPNGLVTNFFPGFPRLFEERGECYGGHDLVGFFPDIKEGRFEMTGFFVGTVIAFFVKLL